MLIGSRRLIQWCDIMNILLKSASENNTDGCHAEIRAEDLAMSIYVASQKINSQIGSPCGISNFLLSYLGWRARDALYGNPQHGWASL